MSEFILIADEKAGSRSLLCLKFAELGYRPVVVSSQADDALLAWQLQMEELGCKCEIYVCGAHASYSQYAEEIEQRFGPIACFVAHANFAIPSALEAGNNGVQAASVTRGLIGPMVQLMSQRDNGRLVIVHSLPQDPDDGLGFPDAEAEVGAGFAAVMQAARQAAGLSNKVGISVSGIEIRTPSLAEGAQCFLAQHCTLPSRVEHGEQLQEMVSLAAYIIADETAILNGAHIVLDDGRRETIGRSA